MEDHTQSVMVALRPVDSEGYGVSLPHLTLVYAGEKPELKPTDFNELAKTTASISMDTPVVQLFTDGLDVYGEEPNKVEVIKLRISPTLMKMRKRVASWNKSSWPYNPHVTIGPIGTFRLGMEIPQAMWFDRIMFSWGEEQLNFWLKPVHQSDLRRP